MVSGALIPPLALSRTHSQKNQYIYNPITICTTHEAQQKNGDINCPVTITPTVNKPEILAGYKNTSIGHGNSRLPVGFVSSPNALGIVTGSSGGTDGGPGANCNGGAFF